MTFLSDMVLVFFRGRSDRQQLLVGLHGAVTPLSIRLPSPPALEQPFKTLDEFEAFAGVLLVNFSMHMHMTPA